MAKLPALVHGGRAFGDVAFSWQAAALLVGAVALTVLWSLPESAEEGPAASFVLLDALVDGFMADAQHLITSQPAADLLGAQVSPK